MPLEPGFSDYWENECPKCQSKPNAPECKTCFGTRHVPSPAGERLLEFVTTWLILRSKKKETK